jgi:hypothetical protein
MFEKRKALQTKKQKQRAIRFVGEGDSDYRRKLIKARKGQHSKNSPFNKRN